LLLFKAAAVTPLFSASLDRTITAAEWLLVPVAHGLQDGNSEGIQMDKQRKSAAELAGMVTNMIGVAGLQVVVNPDPAEGWRPTVVRAPRTVERFLAEKTAERLRDKYELAA
jgi:hypothetical protein